MRQSLGGDAEAYNALTGEVSSWLLNGGGTVLGTQPLSLHCDISSDCASAWATVDLVD